MDELDLFESLTNDRARRLAGARYAKEKFACLTGMKGKKKFGTIIKYTSKTAGVGDLLTKNPVLTGAIAGAAALTTAQMLANMPGKGGGLSMQQRIARRGVQDAKDEAASSRKAKEKPGFLQETKRITSKPISELSDLAAKHPVKAALPMVPVGASLGASLVRAFKR